MELADWHAWWKRDGARGLRRVVMEEWDPIGVADVPEAQDEYDTYIGHVARLLREGASRKDLRRYLSKVRTRYIGLPPHPLRDRTAADAIIRWWQQQPPAQQERE